MQPRSDAPGYFDNAKVFDVMKLIEQDREALIAEIEKIEI